jgi:hypothetical protein
MLIVAGVAAPDAAAGNETSFVVPASRRDRQIGI